MATRSRRPTSAPSIRLAFLLPCAGLHCFARRTPLLFCTRCWAACFLLAVSSAGCFAMWYVYCSARSFMQCSTAADLQRSETNWLCNVQHDVLRAHSHVILFFFVFSLPITTDPLTTPWILTRTRCSPSEYSVRSVLFLVLLFNLVYLQAFCSARLRSWCPCFCPSSVGCGKTRKDSAGAANAKWPTSGLRRQGLKLQVCLFLCLSNA